MRAPRLGWLLLFYAFLGLSAGSGCSRGNIKSSLDRLSRSDADLVALLPRGLDAILDIDVSGPSGLRQLASLDEIISLLPAGAMASLEQLCDHPTLQIEAIAVGISGMGSATPEIAILVRGDLIKERIFAAVQRRAGQTAAVEYHGVPLIEAAPAQAESGEKDRASVPAFDPAHSAAAAMLTPKTVVFGSRVSTRQVVDIFRGEEEGARGQTELMNALSRAPRAKTGRPAVLIASLLPPAMRDQLRTMGLPEVAENADFFSAALAVGDGLDLGVVVGYRTLAAAAEAVRSLQQRTQELRRRPALVFIGLANFLEPLQLVAAPRNARRNQPELHVAYRLPGDELGQLLTRIGRLKQLDPTRGGSAPAGPAAGER